jgi:hypothetical protein
MKNFVYSALLSTSDLEENVSMSIYTLMSFFERGICEFHDVNNILLK